MSGRGEGRGRGGARRGGRGPPQQSRGGGGGGDMGGGRDRGFYAPPSSSSQLSLSEETEKLSLADVEVPEAAPLQPSPPVSTKAVKHPPRPGFGRVGNKIMVRANHFLVTVADRDLHHYDVSISPEVISKKVCREIINELVKCYRDSHLGKRSLAYDGRKSCYTAGALPFSSKDFVVKLVDDDGRRDREFKVSIKFAARADLQHLQEFLRGRQLDVPQETIQALDVVLRQRPSNIYQVVGRSFFHPKLGEPGPLGDGLEYWKGFYQSLRPTQMGLSLNIDTSARAFYEPLLVADYICHYLRKDVRGPLSDMERLKIRRVLKGLRVEVTHGGCKRYKITGLSIEQSRHLMFSMGESETAISVDQYFLQKYNIKIQYGFLPCIKAGSDAKPIYLPMEVCRIVEGQRYTRKLNEKQVTALLNATCQRPPERERSIKAMVNHNNYNGDPFVTEFGIQVKPELTAIEARVLPTPTLMYHATGREAMVQPRVGSWNMIDKRMVTGAKVRAWTCVCLCKSKGTQPNFDRFYHELVGMCCSKGMEFNPKPVVGFRNIKEQEDIEGCLVNLHRECEERSKAFGPLQLLIIVLPEESGYYGRIKRICETELGIVSQCCQPKQAMRCNKQYLENVALKINVKVGGQNTVLEVARNRRVPLLSDLPTIIIGADVTHPSPGEDMSPSIAAVVASVDWPDVTTYRAIVSAQAHREEMIQDLYKTHQDPKRGTVHAGMIREHLMAFYKRTRNKPSRMIFYRDGVSEGQFSQVLLYEMDAIRKACMSIEEGYLPRVTFVVVQKRHHTRLFPGKINETDKSGNILPGTVVDSKICHPTEFDFYLCSHSGIKGTSRPTHYHVLYDENGFSADGLQMLTNNLCYTYARCTRSVSIVPPAYYAHLAAFRARYYMEGGPDDTDGGSTAGEGGPAAAAGGARRPVRALPIVMDNVKEVMFYC